MPRHGSIQRFGSPDSFSETHMLGVTNVEWDEAGMLQAFRNLLHEARAASGHERGEVLHTLHLLYDAWVSHAQMASPDRQEAMGEGVLPYVVDANGKLLTWAQLRRREGLRGREHRDNVSERQQRRHRSAAGRLRKRGPQRLPDKPADNETPADRQRRLARERKRRQRAGGTFTALGPSK
jgi:hypothetical protein